MSMDVDKKTSAKVLDNLVLGICNVCVVIVKSFLNDRVVVVVILILIAVGIKLYSS